MAGRRFLPLLIGASAGVEDEPPMLRPRIVSRPVSGLEERRPVGGPDRAMDVLQYGMAILAVAVAALLAGWR
jgi:hypothetical protein